MELPPCLHVSYGHAIPSRVSGGEFLVGVVRENEDMIKLIAFFQGARTSV